MEIVNTFSIIWPDYVHVISQLKWFINYGMQNT